MRSKAPRNRTISLTEEDRKRLAPRLFSLKEPVEIEQVLGKTFHQDAVELLDFLPDGEVDLLIADPPYNLTKKFNEKTFRCLDKERYRQWMESWVSKLPRVLKPTASIYMCCDWRCSGSVAEVLEKHFHVRNRITWEREKGRGAKANWKNAHEDIWFATKSPVYTFNLDAVKLKRKVLAPYKIEGKPKDWIEGKDGNFRWTHPSNLWTDITVPFWSMPENTEHPTQKPEKLIAKLILAGSREGDVVFDPFLGSGTSSVVAKKLNRLFFGSEIDLEYCLTTEKRLELAETDDSIQGFENDVFLERNSS